MNTIGNVLASTSLPSEGRRFRVRLCRYVFSEIEIWTTSPESALTIAEQSPPTEPKLDFYTDPVAIRAEVYQPWDKQWVRCPR